MLVINQLSKKVGFESEFECIYHTRGFDSNKDLFPYNYFRCTIAGRLTSDNSDNLSSTSTSWPYCNTKLRPQ